MSVTRNTVIDKTALDALATLANSKSVPGNPYSFSTSGGWLTELERLYSNALTMFKVGDRTEASLGGPAYHEKAISSEEFPILFWKSSRGAQFGDTIADSADDYFSPSSRKSTVVGALTYYEVRRVLAYNYLRYFAPSSTMVVALRMYPWLGAGTPTELQVVWGSEPTGTMMETSTVKFRVKSSPLTGRIKGSIIWRLNSTDATDPTYELFGTNAADATVTEADDGYTIKATFDFAAPSMDFTFECGLRVTNYLVNVRGVTKESPTQPSTVYLAAVDRIRWEKTLTAATASAEAMHLTTEIYKVATGDISALQILADLPNTDFNACSSAQSLAGIPAGSISANNYLNYKENQANFTIHTDTYNGVLTGQTRPLHFLSMDEGVRHTGGGAGAIETFTKVARAATVATDDFAAVSPACEYLLPCYPYWQRSTVAFTPVPAASIRAYSGSCIRELYIRRKPRRNSKGIFVENPATSDIPIQIGYDRSGTFRAIGIGLAILTGQSHVTATVFWPMVDYDNVVTNIDLTSSRLLYQADEELDIQAQFINPFLDNPSPGAGQIEWPITADFYNALETILNRLPL